MGIYVNGLWMPTSKEVLMLAITADGEVYSIGFDNTIEGGIFLSYPSIYPIKAIPVPPHGRLGDLNKLEQMFVDIDNAPYSGFDGEEPFYSAEDAAQIIRLAPTIIPATEEEET